MNNKEPIPISKGHQNNFNILLQATKNGDLALVSCIEKGTGKPCMAVCAMSHNDDGSFLPIPIARMFDSDPYELLEDPTPHLNTLNKGTFTLPANPTNN